MSLDEKKLSDKELEDVSGGINDGEHFFEIKYTDPHSRDRYQIYEYNKYSIDTLENAQTQAKAIANELRNPPRDCTILVFRVR